VTSSGEICFFGRSPYLFDDCGSRGYEFLTRGIDYGGIINKNYALEVSDGTHSESFDISDRYQL